MPQLSPINLFILFAALYIFASPSNAFIDALEFLEAGDKSVLIVAERHIPDIRQVPPELAAKEADDITSVLGFLSKLEAQSIPNEWILESSPKKVRETPQDWASNKLIFAIPLALHKLKTQGKLKHSKGIFSDFRREELSRFLLDLHAGFREAVDYITQDITKRRAWSDEDTSWLLARQSDVRAGDIAPRLDSYIRSDSRLKAEAWEVMAQILSQVDSFHYDAFGRRATLGQFNTLFRKLRSNLPNSEIASEIEQCKTQLEQFINESGQRNGEYATDAVAKKVRNEVSIVGLNLRESQIGSCVILTAADASFLIDLLKSQKDGNFSVLFAGRAHAQKLAAHLKNSGYRSRFLEGKMDKVSTLRKTFELTQEDTPIESSVVESRLAEVLAHLSQSRRGDL